MRGRRLDGSLQKCSTCKEHDNCYIGRRLKKVESEQTDLPFDESLKNPFFLPIDLAVPSRAFVDISGKRDISSYFSKELRKVILEVILNDREDPYVGTSNQSREEYPLYDVDLLRITSNRKPIEVNVNGNIKGLDYLTKTSMLKVTSTDKVIDLRFNTSLKDMEFNVPNVELIVFPYVTYSEDDYENEDTYQLRIPNSPKLQAFSLTGLNETPAGLRIEDIYNMTSLKFLYIPNTMWNMDFRKLRLPDNLKYIRLAVPYHFDQETGKYVFYLSNKLKGGYKYLSSDVVQKGYIEYGEYDEFANTISFDSYASIPEGTMVAENISLIYLKD